jgi:ammonium transporter, Amt family
VEQLTELSYALDTFYFLMCGALVMWMAAGFTMLEAGLVRAKNTAEILTKNVGLFSIACIMYMLVRLRHHVRRRRRHPARLRPAGHRDNSVADVTGGEDAPYYSMLSDFFFQVVFVATAMSIVSGAVAERMKLWAFFAFAVVMTGGHLSGPGLLDLGRRLPRRARLLRLRRLRHRAHGRRRRRAGRRAPARRAQGQVRPRRQVNAIPGANLPLATLGTFILWMGWFGFNGGSELKVSDVDPPTTSPWCSPTPTLRPPAA